MNYLGKNFTDKKELFSFLIENEKELINLKKSAIKFADATEFNSIGKKTVKFLNSKFEDDTDHEITRTIIGNTYLWLDSHNDVHDTNLFSKSINERGDKIFHFSDHIYRVTAKVGIPQSIKEIDIQWQDLGINKDGITQALMMDSRIIKDYNSSIFAQYKRGEINQHSVSMQYVKLELAVNDEQYSKEYKLFQKYLPKIGNPNKSLEDGFFWVIKEAKLIEISAVIAGSNELTPTLPNEPSDDTQPKKSPQEVGKTTQNEAKEYFLNL